MGREEKGKKSFEEKAREKSISVGMDHGMALLGELHKNESNSCSCVPEREPELPNSIKTLPPTTQENKVHPPHLVHPLGALRIRTRTFNPAVIMTHVPSKPASGKHQLAHGKAVIATQVLMRFASHRPRCNEVHPPHLTHALGALRI